MKKIHSNKKGLRKLKSLELQLKRIKAEKEVIHFQSANFGADKMYEMLIMTVDEWWGKEKAESLGNPHREKFLELLDELERKIIERYEEEKVQGNKEESHQIQ